MRIKGIILALIGLLALGRVTPALAAQAASDEKLVVPIAIGGDIPKEFSPPTVGYDFTRRTVEIAMRDGITLHTVLLIPKGCNHAPMLLDRTPYGADKLTTYGDGGPLIAQNLFPAYAELAAHGYIIVAQDVRGRYGSGGDYVMNRPLRGPLNLTGVDHATDAYDTIDWLVKHVPESNGKVGTIGGSYDGFTALMSLIDPHPALKASVPMNPMVDVWKGDDWFHNGAFRQEMMGYIYRQTARKDSSDQMYALDYDDYTTFMRYGSAGAFAAAMGFDQLPFWKRLTQHPAYDGYWQSQAVDRLLAEHPLTVPTLLVDGQWDQEDIYGAPAVFQAVKGQANGNAHLVLGPWNHGEQVRDASRLGALDWGSDTGKWFRKHILIPFLDAHLKDDPPPDQMPPVAVFETGTNVWKSLPDWPAARDAVPLYLGANGHLSLGSAPSPGADYDAYVSDPAKPVTYRPRPDLQRSAKQSTWDDWLVDDQRFAAARPDVLVYSSDVLARPVHLAGQPRVDLFASTSGTDSDWIVKVIDVYPEIDAENPEMGGYQLPVSMDILRGRYRDDPGQPRAIPAAQIVHYTMVLPGADHVFLPGHRMMIQIQSSWFPLYDRNPQTYVKNIFDAKPDDYRAATQRVFHRPSAATAVWLPLVQ